MTDEDPANSAATWPDLRIGHGFDVHPWSDDPERPLVLGGVTFPAEVPGLAGHSDADVAAHAVADALLSAAGLGDIGQLFPDTDPTLAGADSLVLLIEAAARVRSAGWVVINVDCTLVLDTPKLAPHRETMCDKLSNAAGGPVRVKGKRTEGLPGLSGGVQGHAVALLAEARSRP